ncbi:MAG TPA: M48 family metallopeptidase [Cytophagaceae bacterium]
MDESLGSQYSEQVNADVSQFPVLDSTANPQVYEYVGSIRDKILSSDDIKYKSEFPYTLKVIRNDSIMNAFCIPGGYIYVYTGLIKYLDTESELAGVLAHEIAHAEQRHSIKQMSKSMGLSFLIGLVFSGDVESLFRLGGNLLVLKFSRNDEREADEYAVKYLYDTSYDPRGVSKFFEKLLNEKKDADVPNFLSTHPASQDRVDDILRTWKEMGSKTGETGRERHEEIKQLLGGKKLVQSGY